MATVGTGTYTYELVEDWAKLPAGWTLGQTGIVTDARCSGSLSLCDSNPRTHWGRTDSTGFSGRPMALRW